MSGLAKSHLVPAERICDSRRQR